MENIKFDQDITVMYIAASSFPNGVLAAHQKLHALFTYSANRRYFGISRLENGEIQYKAAAEELERGEAEKLGLPTLILKKGDYHAITIHDYMKDIPSIQKTFDTLIAQPDIDPEGYCVEEYITQNEMLCMIRIKD
ncbi:transcriptional regulator [Mucilaginibacter panaciglaebae]|uniref:Transcriptional regulator n=1 Tax=Mucilaginibacter panaciglaebae TaxID=502331 RepID=A0ABP7WGB8_9SPHI